MEFIPHYDSKFPKLDIYHGNVYKASTNWFPSVAAYKRYYNISGNHYVSVSLAEKG